MSSVDYSERDYEPRGKWHDHDLWGCKSCRFTSISEFKMREHLMDHVAAGQPSRRLDVPLYDHNGNLIEES